MGNTQQPPPLLRPPPSPKEEGKAKQVFIPCFPSFPFPGSAEVEGEEEDEDGEGDRWKNAGEYSRYDSTIGGYA